MFIDEVKLHATGGKGGGGVTSFARQPYEPRGAPDGGDGGNGGNVVLRASGDVATLIDYHHRPHRRADNGRHGEGDRRHGATGGDTVLAVPVGTVVRDPDGGMLDDLLLEGAEFVAAAGGRGGRGNAAFRTSQRKAPRFHEFGEPGQERWLVLELKLVVDAALVGFPNAGKSSLIARLSAARPKIADYPFTTLTPNLGMLSTEDVDLVVADVPGLIPGASSGRGLGHRFLRHVERAGVLVHVLDCASWGGAGAWEPGYEQRDPRDDLRAVLDELRAYQPDLLERPALVFLNKVDADRDTAEIVLPDLRDDGWETIVGSAATGEGVERLRYRLAELVAGTRPVPALGLGSATAPEDAVPRPVLRPAGDRQAADFAVERTAEGFAVRGDRIERWVRMTDLGNSEGVRYLQNRLLRAGVERALAGAGARRGDPVEIAGAVFDFEPGPDVEPEPNPP